MPIAITNPTQFIGIAALALAAIACFRARKQALWRTLGSINALLAVDVLTGTRFKFGNLGRGWLNAENLYLDRRPIQLLLVGVLAILGIAAARRIFRRRKPWVRVALAGTLGALTLNIVELVSLHQIDALLYAKWGGVLMIGWLWLGCGVLTVTAAAKVRR